MFIIYYFSLNFQVHKKTKAKPNTVERISKHLESLCSQVDVKLGIQPIKYEDLPQVTQILRKNLLENPHLSNEFYLRLIGQLKDPLKQQVTYKKQLQTLSKLKATLQILQIIQKRFDVKNEATGDKDEENREIDADAVTLCNTKDCIRHSSKRSQIKANASLLKKCLLNVIGSGIVYILLIINCLLTVILQWLKNKF